MGVKNVTNERTDKAFLGVGYEWSLALGNSTVDSEYADVILACEDSQ